MKRNTLNYLVDLLALLALAGIVVTGLLMVLILPPGSRGGQGLSLWGWNRHLFGDVHLYLALGFVGLMLLHLWLHWSWVYATTKQLAGSKAAGAPLLRRKVLTAVLVLAVLTGIGTGFLAWAQGHVERSAGGLAPGHTENNGLNPWPTGQTTLAQAGADAGVPVEVIIARLKLPADVDTSETLGRLRKKYDFSMQDLRNILIEEKAQRKE